eukprot:TRINITY_DN65711_c6_g2_i1.p1 TRINITY_DN65711_c6_g2~~TRINITY_DN65711_c6_g2_i1.p1  ORF type:complete len:922 (+),score=105.96 TRINITY_DN65711_c6_g2_i1:40-2805(+)
MVTKAQADDAFRGKNYSTAEDLYTQLIKQENDDKCRSVLLSNRAACFMQMEQWENGLEDAQQAMDLQPEYAKAHFRKITCLRELKRHEQVAQQCTETKRAHLPPAAFSIPDEDLFSWWREAQENLHEEDKEGAWLRGTVPPLPEFYPRDWVYIGDSLRSARNNYFATNPTKQRLSDAEVKVLREKLMWHLTFTTSSCLWMDFKRRQASSSTNDTGRKNSRNAPPDDAGCYVLQFQNYEDVQLNLPAVPLHWASLQQLDETWSFRVRQVQQQRPNDVIVIGAVYLSAGESHTECHLVNVRESDILRELLWYQWVEITSPSELEEGHIPQLTELQPKAKLVDQCSSSLGKGLRSIFETGKVEETEEDQANEPDAWMDGLCAAVGSEFTNFPHTTSVDPKLSPEAMALYSIQVEQGSKKNPTVRKTVFAQDGSQQEKSQFTIGKSGGSWWNWWSSTPTATRQLLLTAPKWTDADHTAFGYYVHALLDCLSCMEGHKFSVASMGDQNNALKDQLQIEKEAPSVLVNIDKTTFTDPLEEDSTAADAEIKGTIVTRLVEVLGTSLFLPNNAEEVISVEKLTEVQDALQEPFLQQPAKGSPKGKMSVVVATSAMGGTRIKMRELELDAGKEDNAEFEIVDNFDERYTILTEAGEGDSVPPLTGQSVGPYTFAFYLENGNSSPYERSRVGYMSRVVCRMLGGEVSFERAEKVNNWELVCTVSPSNSVQQPPLMPRDAGLPRTRLPVEKLLGTGMLPNSTVNSTQSSPNPNKSSRGSKKGKKQHKSPTSSPKLAPQQGPSFSAPSLTINPAEHNVLVRLSYHRLQNVFVSSDVSSGWCKGKLGCVARDELWNGVVGLSVAHSLKPDQWWLLVMRAFGLFLLGCFQLCWEDCFRVLQALNVLKVKPSPSRTCLRQHLAALTVLAGASSAKR